MKDRVESGMYDNQSEVVREGLRLLRLREDPEAVSLSCLKEALAEGLSDLREGRVVDGPSFFAELKAKLQER